MGELIIALLGVVGGVLCGGIAVWILKVRELERLTTRYKVEGEQSRARAHSLELELREMNATRELLESSHAQRLADMQASFEARLLEERARANEMIQTMQAQYGASLSREQQQKEQLKEELKTSFKALSAEILNVQSERFAHSQILTLQPLKDEITRFSKQLSENHSSALHSHTALKTQIESLSQLSLKLSEDAHNLTNALKGENKAQGNWGEVILARVLESSGLQEGREYELQTSMRDDEARLLRPDAVIRLPKSGGEERCVVVDSKTSLLSYERLCNALTEEERARAQKELAASLSAHIASLSAKSYQQYLQGQKLDFVLMFIPIEGAFLEAMHYDGALYDRAYQKGVVLVSPTTIMAVLRIIHNLWQLEYRNANVDKIFTEITKLFKRIEGFEGVLENLGRNIETMRRTYESAMTKYSGKQGVLPKSNEIRRLLQGVGVEEDAKDSKISKDSAGLGLLEE